MVIPSMLVVTFFDRFLCWFVVSGHYRRRRRFFSSLAGQKTWTTKTLKKDYRYTDMYVYVSVLMSRFNAQEGHFFCSVISTDIRFLLYVLLAH